MPVLSTLSSPAPYHLLAYGFMFGTQIYQTFIGGMTAITILPRKEFSRLMQKVFPIYFASGQLAPALVCLFLLPKSLKENPVAFGSLLTPLVAGALNLFFVGPRVSKIIQVRQRQEGIDGRGYDGRKLDTVKEGLQRGGPREKEEVLTSDQMKTLNKRFAKWHGLSSLLNLVGIIGTTSYGIHLSEKLVFE